MIHEDPAVIVAAARTPLGRFLGDLSGATAPVLGATAMRGALARAGLAPDMVDMVAMGCVLGAGVGQNPARQAALGAGLPQGTGAVTVNKVCGSGMMSVFMARDALLAGSATIAVAGGMESMSNAPYLLPRARTGYRMGHETVVDHMLRDGLEDAYEGGRSMGDFGEATAAAYGFSRADQDAYAGRTLTRAQAAMEGGAFAQEIEPVTLATRKGEVRVTTDENPPKVSPEKIPALKAAFRRDGTITAASASAIADGAAAMVLARRSHALRAGLPILAEIRACATHAQEPAWFTTAPIPAIRKVLDRAGWSVGDVDLFEINEAFAVVAMSAQRDLGIPADRLNVHGGACALGHPIGATGARIIVTLLHALRARGVRRGVAALCIGGGEATAIAVEVTA
ncbi:acetyl-CoA C-acyltransferase [Gluconacetobacter azotocaptans]|uniref:Acetyl-CoA C-acyltransferase n=1 Tax=Gluconacetobacter azotocaptans TaxID=142834 RepID=A0A7W4JW88_9PROT|nr:acetyl-CoA C-acyltransferase [Gluconacetobacter azotocaptans]MBB2191947.1 acetyl-CoA C-acyltransferase [Gluconacetobacter azotocaptans]MBM9403750.1 acetyl-CoA C-acyltransferase [Gluconacetobacter azotocaptans]GBQ29026.1 acetyl-CoA acetyltransferase [Gluconacetobacter azotocaptans DSM 13594]